MFRALRLVLERRLLLSPLGGRPGTAAKKAARAARPGRTPKAPRTWVFGNGARVAARTKSEARAVLKRQYGLARLPPGTACRAA